MKQVLYAMAAMAVAIMIGCSSEKGSGTTEGATQGPRPIATLDSHHIEVNGVKMAVIPIVADTDNYLFDLNKYEVAEVRLVDDSILNLRVPGGDNSLSWAIMPGGYLKQGNQGSFPISEVNMGSMCPTDTAINADGTVSFSFTYLRRGSYSMVNPYLLCFSPIEAK